MLIVNSGCLHRPETWRRRSYKSNPLEDEALKKNYKVRLGRHEQAHRGGAGRLGALVEGDRPLQELLRARASCTGSTAGPPISRWRTSRRKFAKKPEIAEANIKVFRAGYAFGETSELFYQQYLVPGRQARARHLPQRHRQPGRRARLRHRREDSPAGRCSSAATPSRPATEILQEMSYFKDHGVVTFQAEDEIAGIGSAIGASFGGALALHHHLRPRPGAQVRDDRARAHHRAAARDRERPARRPLDRHADQDRAGRPLHRPLRPARRGAAAGPRGAEPGRLLLRRHRGDEDRGEVDDARSCSSPTATSAYGSEPFRIPEDGELPRRSTSSTRRRPNYNGQYMPYLRDEKLIRPWAIPGTAGLEHRVGGLEKDSLSRHGLLRRHEPREDGEDPRPEGRERGRGRARTSRWTGPEPGTCCSSPGAGPTARCSTAAEELRAQGKKVVSRPPALAQSACRRTSARCCGASRRCSCPR